MTVTSPTRQHLSQIKESKVNPMMIVALMAGTLTYGILGTVVVPTLPTFERDLRTSEVGATWILTAYLLVGAVATGVIGRLGDMFGKRQILLMTLVILMIGTLISALAHSLGVMIVGRAMQGAGAGLFPLGFGIVRDEFPEEKVAGGIGAMSATIGIGVGIGILIPGPILANLNWHWLFWLPLFVGIVAIACTWRFIPESSVRPGGHVNVVSAALMMTGITAVVLAVSQGNRWGWLTANTLGLLGLGLAVCVAWLIVETRSREPLIHIGMLRIRAVWTTNLAAFLIGAGMYSAFAVYPVLSQLPKRTGFGYGASVTVAGLYILPFAVATVLTGVFAGPILRRLGGNRALVLGCAANALGFGLMAIWSSHHYAMLISTALFGIGLGTAFSALSVLVVRAVPAKEVGAAIGMSTTLRMIGGAVGTQVVASLIAEHHGGGLPTKAGFTESYVVLAAFLTAAGVAGMFVFARHAPANQTVSRSSR